MRSVIPEGLTSDYVISKQNLILQLFSEVLEMYETAQEVEQRALNLLKCFVNFVSNSTHFANIVNYNLPIPDMG